MSDIEERPCCVKAGARMLAAWNGLHSCGVENIDDQRKLTARPLQRSRGPHQRRSLHLARAHPR